MKRHRNGESTGSAQPLCAAGRRTAHAHLSVWPVGLALALGALLLAGCSVGASTSGTGGSTATTTPGASATSGAATPTPGSSTLADAPQSCPSAATLTVIDASVGSGIGTMPVWALGVSGATATLHLGASATRTAHGWQGAMKWVVQAHAQGPIVVQGQLMQGGYPPIWFQSGAQQATTEMAIDQSHPGPGSTSAFAQFPTTIWVPQAGCYQIVVNWHGGNWSAVVGIGR